jgi:hypothetical protein
MRTLPRLLPVFLTALAGSLAAQSSASAQTAGAEAPPEQTLRGMNAIALEVVALGEPTLASRIVSGLPYDMDQNIREYLAEIGRRGGRASRRTLNPEQARAMVRVREARRAYRRFHPQCFWSYTPDLRITGADIPWVVEQLRRHGGRAAWNEAARLCR